MITNKELLTYCLEHLSAENDDNFCVDREFVIIPRTADEDNRLTAASKRLVDLFTTMATLNGINDFSKDDLLGEEIVNILKGTENIHFFPFNFYCQTQGIVYKRFCKMSFDQQLRLIKNYIADRHRMYLSHGYTNTVLQTTCDSYAHKRNGDTGTRKLRTQTEEHGIKHYDFGETNYYLNPDKGDYAKFIQLLNDHNISYPYYTKHNKKLPDLFLKIKDVFIIVEHKHMEGTGGHQNSVIVDIMDFIQEEDPNVIYVSYIDGPVFPQYFGNGGAYAKNTKFGTTQNNIHDLFDRYERSYIINTAGFDKLIEELL